MPLENIKLITDAEAEAYTRIESVKAEAAVLVARAEAKVKELAEEYRARALEENKNILLSIEAQAETERAAILKRTVDECMALENGARSRIDAAADLIVERIVNG